MARMTREQRRQERSERRAAKQARRQAKIEKRRQRESPEAIVLPVNADPLKTYDCFGREHAGHPFRDLWRGKAGFLVGGGPSLNTIDYRRLAERGICSLGINNCSAYVPVRAMTFADPPEKFHYGVFTDPSIIKFVPRPKLDKRVRAKLPNGEFRFTRYRVADCPSVIGFKRVGYFDPDIFLTDDGASWGTCDEGVQMYGRKKCIFTFFCAVRLMHYLGVRRVYMIGVDFAMEQPGTSVGNYAFQESGCAGGNNGKYRVAIEMMRELVPVFQRAGFELYQCNPNSRLNCFPHVPFEDALEDCRAPVPVEPFDTRDWYRVKGNGFAENSTDVA